MHIHKNSSKSVLKNSSKEDIRVKECANSQRPSKSVNTKGTIEKM